MWQRVLFCCLFDDNYEFEKDKLVQLWISAKLLTMEPLEDKGNKFFDFLLKENFILLSRVDILTRTEMYKVNLKELIRVLAQVPMIRDFQMRLEDGNRIANISAVLRHISVSCGNIDQTTFESLKKFSWLRTILFLNGSSLTQVPSDMFVALKSLTAIDLSGSCLKELPFSIGNVRELSYLDLSWTPLEKLPHTMACLTKLQTLRLKGCLHLFSLPKDMKELIKLRHLDFDVLGQLNTMPRGIGALVELRTLPAFILGSEESCNIRELKHMNKLCGKLCISGLEHVMSLEDAKEAALSNKVHLKQLELRWSNIIQFNEDRVRSCNGVLEFLNPNSCLEELQIICFPGSMLPSWIANPQYDNLVSLNLFKSQKWCELPSLGKLPKLKILELIEMNSVTIIDSKFRGVRMNHVAFPALEMLVIDGMSHLRAWVDLEYGDYPRLVKLSVKRCPLIMELHPFPHLYSLRQLEISNCPLLENLPENLLSPPLETLALDACPLLENRYSKRREDSSKIKHIPHVWIGSEDAESSDEDAVEDDIILRDNSDL